MIVMVKQKGIHLNHILAVSSFIVYINSNSVNYCSLTDTMSEMSINTFTVSQQPHL